MLRCEHESLGLRFEQERVRYEQEMVRSEQKRARSEQEMVKCEQERVKHQIVNTIIAGYFFNLDEMNKEIENLVNFYVFLDVLFTRNKN